MSENIQRMESEKDSKIAQLEGQIRGMEEKMPKIGDRGGATADEILDVFLKSPKSGEVPGEVMESFTAMMKQLGAAQETVMRNMKAEHVAAMSDMKAEYDAKINRLLREMDRMARETPGTARRPGRGRGMRPAERRPAPGRTAATRPSAPARPPRVILRKAPDPVNSFNGLSPRV